MTPRTRRELCAVRDCDQYQESRGWCGAHYQRIKRTLSPYLRDDPDYGGPPRRPSRVPEHESMEAKFLALVTVTENGCWEWGGPTATNGDGLLLWCQERTTAHRYAWERVHGPIPTGRHLTNPSGCRCANPSHRELSPLGRGSTIRERRHATAEEKFWALTKKTEGCWEWEGPVRREDGVPQLTFRSKTTSALRFAWDLHHPEDQVARMFAVKTTCGNRCVRPEHLVQVYLGDLIKKSWEDRSQTPTPRPTSTPQESR